MSGPQQCCQRLNAACCDDGVAMRVAARRDVAQSPSCLRCCIHAPLFTPTGNHVHERRQAPQGDQFIAARRAAARQAAYGGGRQQLRARRQRRLGLEQQCHKRLRSPRRRDSLAVLIGGCQIHERCRCGHREPVTFMRQRRHQRQQATVHDSVDAARGAAVCKAAQGAGGCGGHAG